MTNDGLSAADFARVAQELQDSPDPDSTARRIVEHALTHVPGADEVSLTIFSRDEHTTIAATGDLALAADLRQYALRQGPCVEAAVGDRWLRSGDVSRDHRWPRWGPEAARLGVKSICSVQLPGLDRRAGSVNIYSRQHGSFSDPDDIYDATVLAAHSATALRRASETANLNAAIESRHDIGLAQGILMERYGLDQDGSFALLRRISSTREEKLRDVAAHVARTGRLPETPGVDVSPDEP